jgi:DHA1 family multidrug resistance protein-like MFS transporter
MSAVAEIKSPTRSSWIAITALFTTASFAEIVLYSNLAAFTPIYLEHLGYPANEIKFWTGILASAGVLLGFWFVPFWGVLADRYGRKPLIVRSFVVEAVAVALIALAPNVWIFLLGRMITGLALGNTGIMFASVSEHAPRERVALAISLITGSQPLGGVIGSLVGGYVVSAFGIVALWWFDGVLIALVAFMLVLLYHEPFTPRPTPPVLAMVGRALRAVATTPVVVKYFVFSFLATSGYFFSYTFISTRVIELAPGTDVARTIGLVFGIAGIATLLATPVWGLLAGKLGGPRLLPLVTLLTALAYIPLFFARDITQFTLFYFGLACFSPAINSLTFATISLETPVEQRNAVMSMIFMPLNAAILIAPALASVAAGEVRQVFVFSAACDFAALLLLLLTRRVGVTAVRAQSGE